MALIPAEFIDGFWTYKKDPDDKRWVVVDIGVDLTAGNTTALSFVTIASGVTVIKAGAPQGDIGNLLVALIGGFDTADGAKNEVTFRIQCANEEQIDWTIKFIRKDR